MPAGLFGAYYSMIQGAARLGIRAGRGVPKILKTSTSAFRDTRLGKNVAGFDAKRAHRTIVARSAQARLQTYKIGNAGYKMAAPIGNIARHLTTTPVMKVGAVGLNPWVLGGLGGISLGAGGFVGTIRGYEGMNYQPNPTAYKGRGRGMSPDHLNTQGLTQSLHRTRHK